MPKSLTVRWNKVVGVTTIPGVVDPNVVPIPNWAAVGGAKLLMPPALAQRLYLRLQDPVPRELTELLALALEEELGPSAQYLPERGRFVVLSTVRDFVTSLVLYPPHLTRQLKLSG